MISSLELFNISCKKWLHDFKKGEYTPINLEYHTPGKKLRIICFSAPDLNPLEHLCDILGRKIREITPSVQTLLEREAALHREWQRILSSRQNVWSRV